MTRPILPAWFRHRRTRRDAAIRNQWGRSGAAKREAARQGRTMSELVESALRLLLRSDRKREKLVALPAFHGGGTLVDIADRNALYQAMEGR
jgi:hypothetical protein